MSATTESESAGKWIPLESNPEVFNFWAKKAGLVTSQAHFEDIYGLDDDMLAIVPRPVKAVVLLFPIDADGEARRAEEDSKIAREGQPKIDNTIFWVKQTISNACGTIGLIHALANSDVTFTPTSLLQKYIIQCENKTPLERAELLATTPLFADIHAESADSGQSAQTIDTDLHFTCFVEAPDADIRGAAQGAGISEGAKTDTKTSGMRLIELDGRRAGPVDHGECTDLLKDVANLVKARYMSASTSVYFNLMALTTAPQD
ncbi:Ubiquitin carboxyl-terminal hydrolase 3 [Psilocybe cubensis]|uniref:Ubiquitin carboxyl-terminal hydrolase n=2 Tax=Psilocybe cubensis TaxID=181762 RepID=A0A8H7XQD2_PSICU|nr:Ubiquitin carboxyl-terminal hydrolase 3 [Psilocybe cubensis]KAH9475517.1 Ubiquitin carboxyl-terminal hydrolase 3 [Psilocybe cubensis]